MAPAAGIGAPALVPIENIGEDRFRQPRAQRRSKGCCCAIGATLRSLANLVQRFVGLLVALSVFVRRCRRCQHASQVTSLRGTSQQRPCIGPAGGETRSWSRRLSRATTAAETSGLVQQESRRSMTPGAPEIRWIRDFYRHTAPSLGKRFLDYSLVSTPSSISPVGGDVMLGYYLFPFASAACAAPSPGKRFLDYSLVSTLSISPAGGRQSTRCLSFGPGPLFFGSSGELRDKQYSVY